LQATARQPDAYKRDKFFIGAASANGDFWRNNASHREV
jgi:hypothetical protein